MALTAAQKLSAFECLGVVYGPGAGGSADTAQVHTGFGLTLTLTQLDTLRDATSDYLDNLHADVEARVASIIAEWDACAYNTGKIESGAVGDVSGVSYDWETKRSLLRERLQHYVPVMHIQASLARREGAAPAYIQVTR